jgi:hypothetical protein
MVTTKVQTTTKAEAMLISRTSQTAITNRITIIRDKRVKSKVKRGQ